MITKLMSRTAQTIASLIGMLLFIGAIVYLICQFKIYISSIG